MQDVTSDTGHGTNTFAAYNAGQLCITLTEVPCHDIVRPSYTFVSQHVIGSSSLL